MKKVGCLTTFSSNDSAYSLNRVVQDQIKMLVRNGYKPTVIVAESPIWDNPPENYGLEGVVIKQIPNVPVHNEVRSDETFDKDVNTLLEALREHLKDIDVVLTHDIVYQPAALKHNLAARQLAKERPELRWLHWIHSATSPYTLTSQREHFKDEYINLVQSKFPNSFYIYFNEYSVKRVATNFGVDENDVKIVHHPTDYCRFFRFDKEVEEMVDRYDLLSADVICTYPARLDRGKQVEMAVKVIASLKKLGLSVRMIVVDFHSTGGDKVTYREDIKRIGIDWGLAEHELIWTSEVRKEWEYQVPQEVVSQIQIMSNVFVMPSRSESYSLVTQEAALAYSVGILNDDFPPFREIFGKGPYYRKFSSNIDITSGLDGDTETKYDNEKGYFEDIARAINYDLTNNRVLTWNIKLRKERNLDTVWKKELEPIISYDEIK